MTRDFLQPRPTLIKHRFDEKFKDVYSDTDIHLVNYTKIAAMKVSSSIVSIVSFKGDKFKFAGSGTIVSSTVDVEGTNVSTILTSATLIRSSVRLASVSRNIKILVYLRKDNIFEAEIVAYDFHYNIAALKIYSDTPLPAVTLKLMDDSINVNPRYAECLNDDRVANRSHQVHPYTNLFKIRPGDVVVAVGRFWKEPYNLMIVHGKFSADCCNLDCNELFKADCKISKNGTGGPLINLNGEVVGINFYDGICAPFLPINIAAKCLEQFNKIGSNPPWSGLGMTNLYSAHISKLEAIIAQFPDISKGVLVEKVAPGSPAELAGILIGDVIVRCGENITQSGLKFLEIVWDKVGDPVELIVIRAKQDVKMLNLTMLIGETNCHNFYRWPIPKSIPIPIGIGGSRKVQVRMPIPV